MNTGCSLNRNIYIIDIEESTMNKPEISIFKKLNFNNNKNICLRAKFEIYPEYIIIPLLNAERDGDIDVNYARVITDIPSNYIINKNIKSEKLLFCGNIKNLKKYAKCPDEPFCNWYKLRNTRILND